MIKENVNNDIVNVVPVQGMFNLVAPASYVVEMIKDTANNLCLLNIQHQHLVEKAEQIHQIVNSPYVTYIFEIDPSQENVIASIEVILKAPTVLEYKRIVTNLTKIFAPSSQIMIDVNGEGVSLRGKVALPLMHFSEQTKILESNQFIMATYLPVQFQANKRFYVNVVDGEINGYTSVTVGEKNQ
ncbi:hypothetical protein [Brevibacillus reuszeri]|uniref:hypothetical protein n=1 Tax=Brevibacillus reuszeri TaxID=54915 RepID=UPI000CCC3AF4|nr:hypothetical protein [Brevibacillus reuszeri]